MEFALHGSGGYGTLFGFSLTGCAEHPYFRGHTESTEEFNANGNGHSIQICVDVTAASATIEFISGSVPSNISSGDLFVYELTERL